jgi:GntP family gluconate:H+ symporter
VSMELLALLAMIGAFTIVAALLKLPPALATAGSAVVGLLITGNFGGVRHLVEGMFGYFDVILIIATAMVFMKALEGSGILQEISTRMVRRFGKRRFSLTLVAMFLLMIPGMLTGSSTAAALTTGRFAIPVLIGAGLPKTRAAALVALGSIIGMIAPPVNVPVMIIGSGIDMPYVGFDLPLLILSVPMAILVSLWGVLGVKGKTEETSVPKNDEVRRLAGVRVYIPLIVVLALMIASRLAGGGIWDIGIPLMFVVGTVVAFICGRRVPIWRTIVGGVKLGMPVMGILVGAGMFVQIMTLTGGRGFLVTRALDLPTQWLILVASVAMPLFGAVSVYASSSVMGIPIVLALLGNNEIVTAAALSMMAGLGDLLPPIAIVPTLVTQAADPSREFRRQTIKECLLPAAMVLLWAVIVLINAVKIGRLIGL